MAFPRMQASYEAIRSLAYTALSGSYANLGSALSHNAISYNIVNSTDVAIMVSFDGGTTDHVAIPASSSYVQDLGSSGHSLPGGTQIAVKELSSASSGTVYGSVITHKVQSL